MSKAKVIGIVAEYNPFHKGHAYQINTAKKALGATAVVAVMSGNFTQRGEAAYFDKWQRTQLALAGGVDLVLELPVIYALRSSESFGKGGIELLAATGVVSHVVFGCETPHPELLAQIAGIKLTKTKLAPYLSKGMTYGAAVAAHVTAQYPEAQKLLQEPNNILALSYYQALSKLKNGPLPYPIMRQGAGYKEVELGGTLPSAQALRQELSTKSLSAQAAAGFPPQVLALLPGLLSQEPFIDHAEIFYLLLKHTISKLTAEEIAKHSDCSEGLENKFLEAIKATNYPDFLAVLKSKRYPLTRLRRLCYQLLISSPAVPFATTRKLSPQYLRVLGFTDTGRQLLKTMKTTATLPLITKLHKNEFNDKPAAFRAELATDLAATNLYDLLKSGTGYNRDYLVRPHYLK